MYILRWTYRNTGIVEFDNQPGELMQHYMENARAAYLKWRSDRRYEGLKVFQYQAGEEVDVTAVFDRKGD